MKSQDTHEAGEVDTGAAKSDLDRRRFLKWSGAVGLALGAAGATEATDDCERLLEATTTATAVGNLTARQEASRFLAQSTFGGDLAFIDEVAESGPATWLEAQMALPENPLLPGVLDLIESNQSEDIFFYFDWLWWQNALTGVDTLRWRMTFVLSQIFVVSRRSDVLFDDSRAVAAFWDVLARGAFGNFRDLLLAVALQPSMGVYLSHLNNRRSDVAANRFPDENFARELMQLFTIGLFELEADGSQRLDAQGQPIPTYSNAEITEMAKIFTGLTLAPEDGEPVVFGEERETLHFPMVMYEAEHEPGPKTLLNGFVVPGGQTGMEDVEAAIDHLFQHANVGPFIGQHLIRFLVTSNPSPGYVERVAAAFADNGSGTRGDMKAVLRAVLLDSEARDPVNLANPNFGKVREPFVRWMQLGRAFHARSDSGLFRHIGVAEPGEDNDALESVFLAQYPLYAPSVFNFFSPNHQPAGPLTQAGLVAPEMEIIQAYTSVATINAVQRAVVEGEYISDQDELAWLDLQTEVALADVGPEALLDHLDLLLTYGTLSAETRTILRNAILPFSDDPEEQVFLALYLILICPEYAVLR